MFIISLVHLMYYNTCSCLILFIWTCLKPFVIDIMYLTLKEFDIAVFYITHILKIQGPIVIFLIFTVYVLRFSKCYVKISNLQTNFFEEHLKLLRQDCFSVGGMKALQQQFVTQHWLVRLHAAAEEEDCFNVMTAGLLDFRPLFSQLFLNLFSCLQLLVVGGFLLNSAYKKLCEEMSAALRGCF